VDDPVPQADEAVPEFNFVKIKGKSCKACYSPFDVRLPKGDEPDEDVDTVVQPDLLVFCDDAISRLVEIPVFCGVEKVTSR